MSEEMQTQSEQPKVKFLSKEYDLDSGTAEFKFGDGRLLSFNVDALSDDIKRELLFHGVMQKVGDAAAGAKGSFDDGVANCGRVIEQLQAGQWTATRGGGEAKPRVTDLANAIARLKGIEVEKALSAVEAATDEQRKAWRALPAVKLELARIREERARKALEEAVKSGEVLEIEIPA